MVSGSSELMCEPVPWNKPRTILRGRREVDFEGHEKFLGQRLRIDHVYRH